MDPAERLAAYLDGALPADERAAVEVELARDDELARTLAALRRADAALTQIPAATPSDGFEQRLHDALGEVLAESLGSEAAGAEVAGVSSLSEAAAARARRGERREGRGFWTQQPRWLPAAAGAAAGVLVLVGGGIAVTQLTLGGGDDMAAMDADAGGAAITSLEEDGAAAGPVVVLAGRDLDDAMIDALLDGPELGTVAAESLGPDTGLDRAAAYQSMLGVAPPTPMAESAPSDDGGMDDSDDAGETEAGETEAPAADDAPVGDEAAGDDVAAADGALDRRSDDEVIARCLDELLTGGATAVPAYVELGTYEGTEVVLIGLVTPDPATGAYTRTEAWVLDRATCQVLRFSQR